MDGVEVVIPWRGGCPHRTAALDWVRTGLAILGLPVMIGEHDDGEWSKARAVHDRMRRAKSSASGRSINDTVPSNRPPM
jgi:hypothetical protein